MHARSSLLVALAAVLAAALWWRKNPSACPYGQRFWVEAPHPLITRERLREVLEPAAGERVLEIGPGTGYYSLDLADWLGPTATLEIFDLQQEFLDHTMRRAAERGLTNVERDAGRRPALPYADDSLRRRRADRGARRDPRPGRRAARDRPRPAGPAAGWWSASCSAIPHFTSPGALERRGEAAGLRLEERTGPRLGYFARLAA